uniref:mRNA, clone: RTFL01-09-E15 n=1 Tax=Eutrema halophilum TaxID=98038 RepID=E4MWR5_EUTHA|nr:unnamed protein product [Eutrema halophilum]BAJ34049.1 unnamed protein product [Eutrema halophilum]
MALIFFFFLSSCFLSGVMSRSFIIANKCDYTVWPEILSNAGVPPLPTTGFVLQKGETRTIDAPSSWGGRFWGRTLCSTDSDGKFTCATGDCGSGKLECSGYNVQMLVVPQGGGKQAVAMGCKSACEAFRQPEYCCSGAFGSPDTCKPSSYSRIFKSACPRAYSYAYDDKTSTFTCAKSPNYVITFCPSPNTSLKSSEEQSTETTTMTTPTSGSTATSPMVYEGALDESSGSPSTCNFGSHVISVAFSLGFCRMWRFF